MLPIMLENLRIKIKFLLSHIYFFVKKSPCDDLCDSIFIFSLIGIKVVLPNGVEKNTHAMVLSGHFDLPARGAILDQLTYVGHDSCCYCDEQGEVVKTSVMTFPFRNTCTGHSTLRKMKNIVSDCFTALETYSIVSMYFVKNLVSGNL
jgi:hypothetical protein